MPFSLLIIYRDGQYKRQRYAKGEDATRALEMYRGISNVSYCQLNEPDGLVGRYVANV